MTTEKKVDNDKYDLDMFKEELVGEGLSKATASAYADDVEMFLGWLQEKHGGSLYLDKLSEADLIAFREELLKAGFSAGTANRRLAAVKRFSRWLVNTHVLSCDVAAGVNYVRRRQGTPTLTPPDQSQIKALLNSCRRCRHPRRSIAAFRLMLDAGLRVEEIANLTFSDLDFSPRGKIILVRRCGHVQRIPLTRTVWQALEAYLTEERGDDPSEHIFVSQKGGGIAVISLRQSLAQCLRAAGLDGIPLRSLRGVFARNYLSIRPADLTGLAQSLGIKDWNALRSYLGSGSVEPMTTREVKNV